MFHEEYCDLVSMWIRNYSGDEKQVELFRRLYMGLVEGIVHFSFRKNDGSVRCAYGTLDGDIIRDHVGEKSGGSRYDYRNQGLVCYFDGRCGLLRALTQ